jgi:glyoxylase-like metal-dependent hydrolase (beta-lactamase superfamily II)
MRALACVILLCGCARGAGVVAHAPAAAEDLQVVALAPEVWLHTSWRPLPGGDRLPSNGLIVRDGGRVFLVDTAWGVPLTERLLAWIDRELRLPVGGAVITHFHDDRMGGTPVLAARGIPFVGLALTRTLGATAGVPVPAALPGLDTGAPVGVGPLEVFYPGPGHTRDNLVVWVAKARVLFGGCAVRPLSTSSLGNRADADVAAWPAAIRSMQARYGAAAIVVPSHGDPGDAGLLAHTLALFDK